MKVNTDGVLLGAWAEVEPAQAILDIGTGTGVIALMMAQKNCKALIDAVEIDEDSVNQARVNFKNSPWCDRLNIFHSSLQDYRTEMKYDVIISNPPYFSRDQQSPDHKRNLTRHQSTLSVKDLIHHIDRLLAEQGKVYIVSPLKNVDAIISRAKQKNIFPERLMEIQAVEGREPYIGLLKLQRISSDLQKDHIAIQDIKGNFTAKYTGLCSDFYLAF